MIRNTTIAAFLLLILFSCTENEFALPYYESEIVIDGWMEQGQPAKVLLTLSTPYFSEIDSTNIKDFVLTRAKVTVSDGTTKEILTLKKNDNYFPPYYYEGNTLKGIAGQKYQIKVEYGGVTSRAETTIPNPVKLDKVWFELEANNDSLGFLWIDFVDDINTQDYYRSLTKVIGEDKRYIATYFANFKDEYFNGEKITVSLYKGNKNSIDRKDEIHFRLGDTINLKFCTVDEQSFHFWNSFQKEIFNTGNPFASTNARVKSNVTNGLGVWCGYGAIYYQIIAK